jgi:hypothetical protein
MGWRAFQQLCHTILREVLDQTVVSFLDNNDGGRDGAFSGRWIPTTATDLQGEFVVQCKHSARAGHNLERSELDEEFPKAARLASEGRCDVYVLMTNAGVTGNTDATLRRELTSLGVKHALILGSTWINQTIAESSRLRRLVPRLYGLGDLTQILDARAYRQARAVLDAMRTDLAKLVLTGTYSRAAKALEDNGFVLLLGAPATGKTTIAAQLALGAADDFDTAVVKLDTIADLQNRWNPDERQLFWLDDAFGATQFDRSLARLWTIATPRVAAAVYAGGVFVLTSRDYVFHAAREHLKPGAFPLINESQIIVDAGDLTLDERRQILYNHLRHGRQSNSFLRTIQPHLELAASDVGFRPELARRLADPLFTKKLDLGSESAVLSFFDRPAEFLHDVMSGLDRDARAALGLIFINHNWLPSPINLADRDQDLLNRLGSHLGGATDALAALAGSLVQNVKRDDGHGWVFSHPTMVDAYADLLRTPELLHQLIAGCPLDVLLREITCGDVGLKGSLVIPTTLYDSVLERLNEPLPEGDGGWQARSLRTTFLSTRCDRQFLGRWLAEDPARLHRLEEPGLMLEGDSDNELVARLNEFGLYPDDLRVEFARSLIDYCLTGEDPAVLWNGKLRSVLTGDEKEELRARVRDELLSNLPAAIQKCTEWWSSDRNPEEAVQPLRDLVYHLPREFPEDAFVARATKKLDSMLDDWVARQDYEEADVGGHHGLGHADAGDQAELVGSGRSVFDDLVVGRGGD